LQDAISKYKMSAHICNVAVAHLVSLCVPGAAITDLCSFGDLFLAEQVLNQLETWCTLTVGSSMLSLTKAKWRRASLFLSA
jgi:hypothetical protein